MSRLNPVAREPVAVVVLAAILTWALARYGVKVDPQQASDAAGVVLLVGGAFARQLVRPTAKDEEAADDSTLRKVVGQVVAEMREEAQVPEKDDQATDPKDAPPPPDPGKDWYYPERPLPGKG